MHRHKHYTLSRTATRRWSLEFNTGLGIFTHELQAGASDEISVFEEDGRAYVLARNYRVGYVSLEIFHEDEAGCSVFDQSDAALPVLGMTPHNAINHLLLAGGLVK